jgi:hypothetical protein
MKQKLVVEASALLHPPLGGLGSLEPGRIFAVPRVELASVHFATKRRF